MQRVRLLHLTLRLLDASVNVGLRRLADLDEPHVLSRWVIRGPRVYPRAAPLGAGRGSPRSAYSSTSIGRIIDSMNAISSSVIPYWS